MKIQRKEGVWILIVTATLLGSFTFPTLLNATITSHSHGDAAQHDALAASLPLFVDSNYHLKERAGDAKSAKSALQADENFVDPENHCEFCTRLVYKPGQQGIAGIAYSTSGKSLDLSDAKSVQFFVRGDKGGEKVKFEAAGKDIASQNSGSTNDDQFSNIRFAIATKTVTLSDTWKSFTIDVGDTSRRDLTGITHPFAIDVLKGDGDAQKQVVIYVKAIIFDTRQEANALTTTLDTTIAVTNPSLSSTANIASIDIAASSASANGTSSAKSITINATASTTEGIASANVPRDMSNTTTAAVIQRNEVMERDTSNTSNNPTITNANENNDNTSSIDKNDNTSINGSGDVGEG